MESMTPILPPLVDPLLVPLLKQPAIAEDEKISRVMHPTGYRILVEIMSPQDSLKRWQDSKLVMPDETRDREWAAQHWAVVMELGPEAYRDEKRFARPWCQVGDYIMMRPYSGMRFMVNGHLYALINDDTVLAVCTDPGEVERA